MAGNTGEKIVLTLKQEISGSGIPTGLTKPDIIGDPDYIAPYVDLIACPITFNTACPLASGTSGSNSIEFEFSLPNSVVNNPAINLIKVMALSSSGFAPTSVSFTLPNTPTNYFHSTLFSLGHAAYTLNIQYFSGSNFVRSCSISGTVYNT
jgi:hypothetical protein